MKKIFICCLILALVTILASSLSFGADWSEMISVHRNKVNLEVNSVRVTVDNFLYNGTTYVPIRAVAELLGKEVVWNANTNVASINDIHISRLESISLNLYFPDSNAQNVFLEKREMLVLDAAVGKAAVQGLINGPVESDLASSIPEGTRLFNIYILDKVCYVDFSREFIDNHSGGSAGEMMTLASVVNTLTDFDSIDMVQILVEGKSGETLGNIRLDRPLGRMANLIGSSS
jgi:spore germination protein GerM